MKQNKRHLLYFKFKKFFEFKEGEKLPTWFLWLRWPLFFGMFDIPTRYSNSITYDFQTDSIIVFGVKHSTESLFNINDGIIRVGEITIVDGGNGFFRIECGNREAIMISKDRLEHHFDFMYAQLLNMPLTIPEINDHESYTN